MSEPDHEAAWLAWKRLALLGVDPSGVRADLEAAAACACECHPQPGDSSVHRDGVCHCQLTVAERRQRVEWARERVAQADAAAAEARVEHNKALAAEAGVLHVEAHQAHPAVPLVILGTVDGYRFVVRERLDDFTVTLENAPVPDGAPLSLENSTVVGQASFADLFPDGPVDYRELLRTVVAIIRTRRRVQACTHPHRPRDRHCPDCGVPLIHPALPDGPPSRPPTGNGGWSGPAGGGAR